MSLTVDDVAEYAREDDDGEPLGVALAVLAVDVETDAVADVYELREQTGVSSWTQTCSCRHQRHRPPWEPLL